jgi:hypothetical protein
VTTGLSSLVAEIAAEAADEAHTDHAPETGGS